VIQNPQNKENAMPHIRTLSDISVDDFHIILNMIDKRKQQIQAKQSITVLNNHTIGLLFEKPSTRTRAGFEIAAQKLGATTIYLPASELQLKRGEPVSDVARILGSYMDCIVARVNSHQTITDLAQYADIPVVNGLCDLAHPTQGICDIFTIREHRPNVKGLTLAYIGDGNNVCHSLLFGCAMMGMHIHVACPKGYEPNANIVKKSQEIAKQTNCRIFITESSKDAAKNADILYTDTWVSMGQEDEKQSRIALFTDYQINDSLLSIANSDALIMHCLPAYRGLEIADNMIDHPQSIIWQQGANKMYSATGILEYSI